MSKNTPEIPKALNNKRRKMKVKKKNNILNKKINKMKQDAKTQRKKTRYLRNKKDGDIKEIEDIVKTLNATMMMLDIKLNDEVDDVNSKIKANIESSVTKLQRLLIMNQYTYDAYDNIHNYLASCQSNIEQLITEKREMQSLLLRNFDIDEPKNVNINSENIDLETFKNQDSRNRFIIDIYDDIIKGKTEDIIDNSSTIKANNSDIITIDKNKLLKEIAFKLPYGNDPLSLSDENTVKTNNLGYNGLLSDMNNNHFIRKRNIQYQGNAYIIKKNILKKHKKNK